MPDASLQPGWQRWLWLLLAYLSIGMAMLGVILPGLPTTGLPGVVHSLAADAGSRFLYAGGAIELRDGSVIVSSLRREACDADAE